MTATFFKRYWLILISCCGLGGVVLACASDGGDDYGTSNFTPEVFVDAGYSPFFYSDLFYYGIGHDEEQNTRFVVSDSLAWARYLSKSPAGQAAYSKYLKLAKRCETFAVVVRDYWGDTPKKAATVVDTLGLHRALREGMASASDRFVRERYWFQWVRSCYFNGAPAEAIALYAAFSPVFPSDDVHFRTMGYMAGAYYKLHDYGHANYYFSLVFDSCVSLRTTAHYSFHPQEEKDWRQTLGLCKSVRERTTLWQMLGIFYQDPQRAIGEIYALDPGSDELAVLLSRAVNQTEQGFGVGATNVAGMVNPGSTDNSRGALAVLVDRIATAGNTAQPWIWHLAAGYLATLDGRFRAADAWYDKARRGLPADTMAQAQYRLLVLINRVAGAKGVTAKLEQSLVPDLAWLTNLPSMGRFRYGTALEWLKQTMSKRYAAAGDLVKAECFVSSYGFYSSDRNVEALKAFLNKPGKTPNEVLCAQLSAKSVFDLYNYQAVRLCLDDKIDEAMVALQHAIPDSGAMLPGNPFNARINDCHDCDHDAPQKVKYSRYGFLVKLQELKTKIAAGQDVYTNAVLMGNAHYNITQFGNARAFFECTVIGDGDSQPSMIDSVFRGPLLSMSVASRYYTMALSAAKTDEQKAKCEYLLAKCQRNDWYSATFFADPGYDSYDKHSRDFVAWDGFKALRQYAQTQYYKDVLRECGYFRTFANH